MRVNGMKGTCPACGATYWGWALLNPREQRCSLCGGILEIRKDGTPVPTDIHSLVIQELLSDRYRWQDALNRNMLLYFGRN